MASVQLTVSSPFGPVTVGETSAKSLSAGGALLSESAINAYSASIAESISLADTISAASGLEASISESMALADTVSAAASLSATIAESISLLDTLNAGTTFPVSITESITLVDTVNSGRKTYVSISEAMSLSDSFSDKFYPLLTIYQTDCIVSHRDDGVPEQPAVKFTRTDPTSLPREAELQYSDVDQDYATIPQIAKQQYGRIKNGIPEPYAAATSTQKMSITTEFGIRANGAITLIYDLLYRMWTETVTIEFEHPDLRFEAGDIFILIGDFGQVIGRIEEAVWTKNRTNQIRAVALAAAGPPLIADSGFPSFGSGAISGLPNVGIGIVKPAGANIVGAQDNPTNVIAVTVAAGAG